MESIILLRQKTYDPILRAIHALNAASVILLMVTGFGHDLLEQGASADALWHIHIFSGYSLISGLVARTIWGFIGPKYARWPELAALKKMVYAVKSKKKSLAHIDFGHPPMAMLAYVFFYTAIFFLGVSGIILAASEHGMGPLTTWLGDDPAISKIFEKPHKILGFAICGFIILHLAAITYLEKKEKRPIAQAMVSGFQYIPLENSITNHLRDTHHDN